MDDEGVGQFRTETVPNSTSTLFVNTATTFNFLTAHQISPQRQKLYYENVIQ